MSLRGVTQAVGYAASKIVSKSSAWSTFNTAQKKVHATVKRAREADADDSHKRQKVVALVEEDRNIIVAISPVGNNNNK
jgi:hypothetical protein